jgi:hypothetical protein
MEHPLPTGIFVEMSNEFDDWTEEDFDREIKRLRQRVKELEAKKVTRVDYEEVVLDPPDDDEISCTIPMFVRWLKMVNTPVTCLTHIARHVKMMRTKRRL